MTYSSRRWVPACAALALALGAAPLQALDLTGTWTGKIACKDFDGRKFGERFTELILQVSQTGDLLAVNLDDFDFYNGRAIPAAGDPDGGEVVLAHCGTDDLPAQGSIGEIVRARVGTQPGSGAGSLKALSIFEGLTVQPAPQAGTCKWRFRRTSTADPNVLPCP
jgi:hypothetical protein